MRVTIMQAEASTQFLTGTIRGESKKVASSSQEECQKKKKEKKKEAYIKTATIYIKHLV